MRAWASARSHVTGVAWSGLDQAFASLSNVAVSLALTRGAGARGLGDFTVALGVYLIVLGFQRTLIADPLLTSAPTAQDRDAERAALGGTVLFSTVASLPVLGVGAILGRSEFLALAAVLPFVCVQDLLRYVAFRRLQPRSAAVLDFVWTLVSVGTWSLIRTGPVSRAVLLWGAGAALSTFSGLFLLDLAPGSIRAAWRWWNRHARGFGLALTVEGVVYTVAGQSWVFIVASTLGSTDLGALRAAQMLVALSAPVLAAFSSFALPRMARRAAELTLQDTLLASVASVALAAPAVLCALVAAHPLTRLLYGSSIAVPHQLLAPVAVASLLSAAAAGPYLSLKARRQGRLLVSTRTATGALGLVFVAAALDGGVVAVAWAAAAQNVVHLIAVSAFQVRAKAMAVTEPA